jgi:hypothetical protein
VSPISCDEVVRASGIGTFDEDVVVRVGGNFETPPGNDKMTAIPDELQKLKTCPFTNSQLRSTKHIRVLVENGLRNVKARRFGDCDEKNCALQAIGLEGSRYQDVGIYHQAQS